MKETEMKQLKERICHAVFSELGKANATPFEGMECVVNCTLVMLRSIADVLDCPDKDKFVTEAIRSTLEQLEK